jgi:hypothetical protein
MGKISSRRILIVGLLAVAACTGAVVRHFSPPNSTAHSLGTLFMVMWVPIVGNIIFFFAKKRRPIVSVPRTFVDGMPFEAHASVEIALSSCNGAAQVMSAELRCLVVVGTEGFSSRIMIPQASALGDKIVAQVEFLSPAVALPKVSASYTFNLVQGKSVVGQGRFLGIPSDA